jgi:MYXO-CTERM domain-containing protein
MKTALQVVLLLFAISTLCLASPIATFSGGNYTTHGYDQTVGWVFTVNSNITVDEIFWYDPTESFTKSFPVLIWDNSGTPMIPVTNVGSGAGAWDSVSGYWDVAISPVALSAGSTYVIGGLIAPGDPILGNPVIGLTTSPAITFVDARAIWGTTLQMPTVPQGTTGYFGPNFGVAEPSGVPEPGAWGLAAAGLMVLAAGRRRRA